MLALIILIVFIYFAFKIEPFSQGTIDNLQNSSPVLFGPVAANTPWYRSPMFTNVHPYYWRSIALANGKRIDGNPDII